VNVSLSTIPIVIIVKIIFLLFCRETTRVLLWFLVPSFFENDWVVTASVESRSRLKTYEYGSEWSRIDESSQSVGNFVLKIIIVNFLNNIVF
jgi:hypothetical protein